MIAQLKNSLVLCFPPPKSCKAVLITPILKLKASLKRGVSYPQTHKSTTHLRFEQTPSSEFMVLSGRHIWEMGMAINV